MWANKQCFREWQGREGGKQKSDTKVLFEIHHLPAGESKSWNRALPLPKSETGQWVRKSSSSTSSYLAKAARRTDSPLLMPHAHGKAIQYCSLFPE